MKKLNNRGFAVSTILYGILSLIVIILMIIFGVMKASKDMNEDLVESLTNSMNACVLSEVGLENCYLSGENCDEFLNLYEKCKRYGNDNSGVVNTGNTLREKILDDNIAYPDNENSTYVNNTTPGIDFSLPSSETNGRGLYVTSDLTKTEDIDGDGTGEPVYYYRGAVENNYVQFGTYQSDSLEYRGYYSATSTLYQTYETLEACNSASSYNYNCKINWNSGDEIVWRIVRINEDGSIRLAYQGTWSNSIIDIDSGWYSIQGRGGYGSSYVKTAVDNWYVEHLNEKYSTLIADSGFCNDGILYSESSNRKYYEGYNRLKNQNHPQFKCYGSASLYTLSGNSSGNGGLTYPIGTLTGDELVYSGMSLNSNKQDNYLLKSSFWTMTQAYKYGSEMYMFGYFTSIDPWYWKGGTSEGPGYRPVINLQSTVELSDELPEGCTSLNGTASCPYIIKTN